MRTPRLMAVLAHPDDESLEVGGTLAKYASEGVDVFLLTATRGDSGRFRGYRLDDHQHPGPLALANIREGELRAAASALGLREVSILNYHDQHLDRANPREAVAAIVGHMRRVQPDVVMTFGPTFRYVPRNLRAKLRKSEVELHLDALNRELVDRLQRGGETFVSNAVVGGHYVLRACIVNFHTTQTDVEAVPDIVARIGREVEAELRMKEFTARIGQRCLGEADRPVPLARNASKPPADT